MICTQEDIDYNNTITTVTTITGTNYTYKVDWAPGPYMIKETYPSYSFTITNNPCQYCPNNKANNKFASGFCHCILGTPTIY